MLGRGTGGAAPGDPHRVMPVPPGDGAGYPPRTGEDPNWDFCPTDPVWGSGARAGASHPPHSHNPGFLPRCPVQRRRLWQEQGLCHPPESLHGLAGTCGQEGDRVSPPPRRAPLCPGHPPVGDQAGKDGGYAGSPHPGSQPCMLPPAFTLFASIIFLLPAVGVIRILPGTS